MPPLTSRRAISTTRPDSIASSLQGDTNEHARAARMVTPAYAVRAASAISSKIARVSSTVRLLLASA